MLKAGILLEEPMKAMTTKKCCRCCKQKSIHCFNKAKRGLYKVHSICKACKKAYMKEYASLGKLKISVNKYKSTDKGQSTIKAYTKSNKNKEIQKLYRASSKGKVVCVAKLAKYRAAKKQAMPSWANTKELKAVYANCPYGLEVDHIIPLQGENVSGLHVPWNLQYLSSFENKKKGNKCA